MRFFLAILYAMDNELLTKIVDQNAKLDAIYASVEKTRKYFQIVLWVTVATVVLPIIGLMIALPIFLNTYMSSFDALL